MVGGNRLDLRFVPRAPMLEYQRGIYISPQVDGAAVDFFFTRDIASIRDPVTGDVLI
jgi:hypothetical protein